MKILSRIRTAAAVTVFVSLSAGVVLAQNAPNTGTETITAVPAASPPEAAPAAAAPAATTTAAPAATVTTPTAATPATTDTEPAKGSKKKAAKMTRQQEIDKSIDSGTVPARYRNSVPKEYQQYIPFEKR